MIHRYQSSNIQRAYVSMQCVIIDAGTIFKMGLYLGYSDSSHVLNVTSILIFILRHFQVLKASADATT